jgi:hypothetical protein
MTGTIRNTETAEHKTGKVASRMLDHSVQASRPGEPSDHLVGGVNKACDGVVSRLDHVIVEI